MYLLFFSLKNPSITDMKSIVLILSMVVQLFQILNPTSWIVFMVNCSKRRKKRSATSGVFTSLYEVYLVFIFRRRDIILRRGLLL